MPNLTRIAAGALIVLAVLLGVFAWSLSRKPAVQPQTTVAQATFPVVVAARALPAGKPITVDALRVESLPINPNGAFADPSQLAGRVPVSDIGVQSPVLEGQLSSGLAEGVEQGERAIAVRVDESNAVGNRLRPGNFVDVFFTLKRDSNGGINNGAEIDRSQARLLLSKVRVLAFGTATPSADTANDATGMVRTAVLAVPVADIDKLTLAEGAGRLVFALRNPKDAEIMEASAFAMPAGVLKIAASAPAGVASQDSTRAAAGLALNELSGSTGETANVTRAVASPHAAAPVARVAARASGSTEGIEVIRGGRTETVAR